jgi:predicted transposase YbfD/YdcC
LAGNQPNAIKIWAKASTANSSLTLANLKLKTPGMSVPQELPEASIAVSRSSGPDFQQRLIAGVDFSSGSGQSVTLTGDLGMSFAQTSPRGSSLQFHVMAVYLPVPIVTVDVAPGQVTEDDGQKLVYTFTRSIATASDLVVSYSVGGGAIAGDVYTGLPFGNGTQTITIPANQPSATLEVLPAAGKDALHLLNAWSSDLQVCLGQVAVDEGSNEITAVPKLSGLLELTGAVVTLDAMHCQKETAQAICDKAADYVLTVKGNQPTLHEQIQKCFEDAGDNDYNVPGLRRLKKTERGHGRIERREYSVMPAPKSLRDTGEWADLKTIGMVYRERELNGTDSHEVVFFISSLPPSVQRLAKHLRGHWGIENSLH